MGIHQTNLIMKTIFKVMFLLCTIGLVPSVAKAQEKVITDDEASTGIVMVTIDAIRTRSSVS